MHSRFTYAPATRSLSDVRKVRELVKGRFPVLGTSSTRTALARSTSPVVSLHTLVTQFLCFLNLSATSLAILLLSTFVRRQRNFEFEVVVHSKVILHLSELLFEWTCHIFNAIHVSFSVATSSNSLDLQTMKRELQQTYLVSEEICALRDPCVRQVDSR